MHRKKAIWNPVLQGSVKRKEISIRMLGLLPLCGRQTCLAVDKSVKHPDLALLICQVWRKNKRISKALSSAPKCFDPIHEDFLWQDCTPPPLW